MAAPCTDASACSPRHTPSTGTSCSSLKTRRHTPARTHRIIRRTALDRCHHGKFALLAAAEWRKDLPHVEHHTKELTNERCHDKCAARTDVRVPLRGARPWGYDYVIKVSMLESGGQRVPVHLIVRDHLWRSCGHAFQNSRQHLHSFAHKRKHAKHQSSLDPPFCWPELDTDDRWNGTHACTCVAPLQPSPCSMPCADMPAGLRHGNICNLEARKSHRTSVDLTQQLEQVVRVRVVVVNEQRAEHASQVSAAPPPDTTFELGAPTLSVVGEWRHKCV